MLAENKNLKDSKNDSTRDTFSALSPIEDKSIQSLSMSYTKTNKLITALYMVTDVIDDQEPIRHKLRTLGSGIISDIHSAPSNACNKIYEIMSFLEIAFAINIISEMNCNILRKEFLELNQSIKESTDKVETINRQINLSEFFTNDTSETYPDRYNYPPDRTAPGGRAGIGRSIGHQNSTRIGVQKGSTLMKALSDKTHLMSNYNSANLISSSRGSEDGISAKNNYHILKKKRDDEIVNIIKAVGGSATIKDIKDKIQTTPEKASLLISCSEKTIQRELMSMTKIGVLYKEGSKRWSKYLIKT